MNYPELLATLPMTTILPPPGWLFDEVEPSTHWTNYGPEYDDPRIEWENTVCSRCGDSIGPMEGCDPDAGYSRSDWRIVYDLLGALFCEECAEEIDPVPLWVVYSMKEPT